MRDGTVGERGLGENMSMARTPWKGTEPLSQRAGLPSIRSGRSRDALVPSTADLLTQPFLRLRAVLCKTSASFQYFLLSACAVAMGTQRTTNASGYLV